jgi:antitoxin component YwqK of YwqJK toxin-antitoxin module
MRISTLILLVLVSSLLEAQQLDTTEVKNGVYWVYETGTNGLPVGEGLAYDTTGVLRGSVSYRQGFAHGDLVWYDRQGRKTWTVPYVKGYLHGTAMQYDSLDRKIHSITFREGERHGPEIFYYPNGRVHYRVENRYGQIHGTLRSYHTNGRIEWTGGFREGEMHGERILRDSTGALYTGEYLTTFPMNMGHYRVTCTQGRPHGELIMQRDDGSVSYTGQYVNGRPDGEFLYLDREGEVYRKAHFENGVFQHATRRGGDGGRSPQPYETPLPEER